LPTPFPTASPVNDQCADEHQVTGSTPDSDRAFSSTWDNDNSGFRHAASMLNSAQGWTTGGQSPHNGPRGGSWMQLDLGSIKTVVAVKVQGRVNPAWLPNRVKEFVTQYKIKVGCPAQSVTGGVVSQSPAPARFAPLWAAGLDNIGAAGNDGCGAVAYAKNTDGTEVFNAFGGPSAPNANLGQCYQFAAPPGGTATLMLQHPLQGQTVRIYPIEWNGKGSPGWKQPGMRADAVTCDTSNNPSGCCQARRVLLGWEDMNEQCSGLGKQDCDEMSEMRNDDRRLMPGDDRRLRGGGSFNVECEWVEPGDMGYACNAD